MLAEWRKSYCRRCDGFKRHLLHVHRLVLILLLSTATTTIAIMVAATLFPPAALYQRDAHDLFLQLGLQVAGHKYRGHKMNTRRFWSEYGTRPDVCAKVWNNIIEFTPNLPSSFHLRHLFWFLKFVKQ